MVMNKAMEPNANHVVNSVNLSNEDKNRDFNPSVLGREFVRQYYTMLNEGPQNLFRFYSDNSSLIHGNEPGESVTPAYGQIDINKKLMSLNFRDCHTKIRQVDSLETVNKSVVIQVIGELSNNGQPMRRFFQTFILAPRSPTHYYVRNDIFRYQDEVFVDDDEGYTEENIEDSNHVIDNTTIDTTDNNVLTSSLVVSSNIVSSSTNQPLKNSINNDKLNGQLSEPEKLSNDLERTNKFSCMNPAISPINVATTDVDHLDNDSNNSDSEQSIDTKFKSSVDKQTVEKDLISVKDEQQETEAASPTSESETDNQQTVSTVLVQQEKQNEPRTYATMVQKKFGSLSNSSSALVVNSIDKNKDGQLIKSNEDSLVNTVLGNNLSGGLVNRKDSDYISNDWHFETTTNNETTISQSISNHHHHHHHENKRNGRESDDLQVFVGNLPQDIDENQLREYFIQYGNIVDVRICQKQGKTPNYGFITFNNTVVVKKILSKKPIFFNGHRINVEEKRSQSGRNNSNQGFGRSNKDKDSLSSKFNNSSSGSGSLSAFSSRGNRDSDRNRAFNSEKRKTSSSNNSGNSGNSRAQQSNFRR